MKLVSIVIPVYNAEKTIKECINSILNQTYKNIEIICINDGSTDNSMELLNKYSQLDSRIKVIDKENRGVSSARNLGIKNANGEYISFVDSDDWLEANMIEKLINVIKNKNVDVVRCNNYIDQDKKNISFDKEINNKTIENKKIIECIEKIVEGKIPAYVPCLIAKKELVLKTNLFDEKIVLMEDALFYIDLFSKCKSIYFLNDPLYHYRTNLESCTQYKKNYVRNINNIILVNRKMKELFVKNNINIKNINDKIDKVHSIIIVNLIAALLQIHDKNFLEKKFFVKICSNPEIQNIFINCKYNNVKLHIKIPAILIQKRRYNILYIFYLIRGKIAVLRKFIRRMS